MMMTDQLKKVRMGRGFLLCGMVLHTIGLGYVVARGIWSILPEMGVYIFAGLPVLCITGMNATTPVSKQELAAQIWLCIFSSVPLVGLIVLTVRYVRTSRWLAAAAQAA